MYDYYALALTADVTIVGVENCENFRWVSKQKDLFRHLGKVLFVCRYPQSGDLVRWLEKIPNRYVHFGDFDLAGIHIFLTEFYPYLGNRSSYFIPADIEKRLKNGSMVRYNLQYPRFHNLETDIQSLQSLVDVINRYHRCYDQEGYIG